MRIIPTDTLDEEDDGGGNSEPSSTLLQVCGPREPHPRQVDILLDRGRPALPALCNLVLFCISQGEVTLVLILLQGLSPVKYNGRPQTL